MVRPRWIRVSTSNALLIALAAALPPICAGCELLPLATLGAVFDIAGTAATAGPAVYQQGKLRIALMADYPGVKAAVRAAAEDLQLRVFRDRKASKHHDIWDFQLRDERNSKIEITVERRTPMLCRCCVDVGLFGSEPTARLVMARVAAHLPHAAIAPTRLR